MDERKIFSEAIQITNHEERQRWLDDHVGCDGELRARIDKLLRLHDSNESFLENSPLDGEHSQESDLENATILDLLRRDFPNLPEIHLRELDESSEAETKHWKKAETGDQPIWVNGRYQILGEISRGGVGTVRHCRDYNLGRDLAAKILLDSHAHNRELAQRLVEEAQIAGQLQHPGIASVHELGQLPDRRPYFTMKLVKGATFASLLRKRKEGDLELGRFLVVFGQICQTLAYAHSRGVIHRDLKPSNIMIGRFGEVQVMDWGLAKVLGGHDSDSNQASEVQVDTLIQTIRSTGGNTPTGDTSNTKTGSIMGTPAYMPPEQALGQVDVLDERADVFGLGAILCEILTGKPPYVASSTANLFRMAANGDLQACWERLEAAEVEPELVSLTRACLEPDVDQRLANAKEVVERLESYQESYANRLKHAELERATAAASAVEAEQRAKAERRSRILQLGLAVVVIGFTLGGIAMTNRFLAEQKKQTTQVSQSLEAKSNYLYVAHMQMASQAWNEGAVRRVQELLKAHVPAEGEQDRRGYEWYYLNGLLEQLEQVPTIDFGEIVAVIKVDPLERYLIASGNDGTIRIYDFNSRELLQVLKGHSRKCLDYIVSADGEWMVSLDWGALRIWRFVAGQFEQVTSLDKGVKPFSTRMTQDGTHLLIPTQNREVFLWDARQPSEFQQRFSMPDRIVDLNCRMDNQHFLVALQNGTITEWDWTTGEQIREIGRLSSAVRSMGVSPDGSYLALATQNEILTCNLNQPEPEKLSITLPTGPVESVLPLDTSFLVRTRDMAAVWDYAGNPIHQMYLGDDYGVSEPSADGTIAFHSFDHWVTLCSQNDWSRTRKIPGHSNTVYSVEITDSNKLVSGSRDGTVRIRDLGRKLDRTVELRGHSRNLWAVSFSPQGDLLATAAGDSQIVLWEAQSGKEVGRLQGHESSVQSVAFSPQDNLLASASEDHRILLWNYVTREQVAALEGHDQKVNVVQFSPDGSRLLSGGDDGKLIVWELESRQPVASFEISAGYIWAAAFARNSNELLFGGTNHELYKWRYEDQAEPEVVYQSTFDISFIAVANNGKTLALTTSDGTITLMDYASGAVIANPTGHTSDAMGLAFSPDDRTLVSAGSDGKIVFWSLNVVEPTLQINAHDSHVHAVAFSPDGTQIASASWDGTAKLWRLLPKGTILESPAE